MNPNAPVRFLELKELVSTWRGPGTLVLVTHALTVRPMTGFLPGQAEAVVLKPTPGSELGAQVVGRIPTPKEGRRSRIRASAVSCRRPRPVPARRGCAPPPPPQYRVRRR